MLENERGEESFVLLSKFRRRFREDENGVVEEVNFLLMWVVLEVGNLSMPGLENEGEDEIGSLEENPFAKLKVRLLGNRDKEELNFFRATGGGVDVVLAAVPFVSLGGRVATCHRCSVMNVAARHRCSVTSCNATSVAAYHHYNAISVAPTIVVVLQAITP
jgi:hypothetical protein